MDEEAYAARFQELCELFLPTKEDFSEAFESTAKILQNVDTTAKSITLDEVEVEVSYSKDEKKESYLSSKSGNLSASFEKDLKGSFSIRDGKKNNHYDLSIQEEWKFQMDGNLPTTSLQGNTLKATSDGSQIDSSTRTEVNYSWGVCDFQVPNYANSQQR